MVDVIDRLPVRKVQVTLLSVKKRQPQTGTSPVLRRDRLKHDDRFLRIYPVRRLENPCALSLWALRTLAQY